MLPLMLHRLPCCLQRKSRVAYFYDPDIGQYYYGALRVCMVDAAAAACSPHALVCWPAAGCCVFFCNACSAHTSTQQRQRP